LINYGSIGCQIASSGYTKLDSIVLAMNEQVQRKMVYLLMKCHSSNARLEKIIKLGIAKASICKQNRSTVLV
jgi:hypothetical protein